MSGDEYCCEDLLREKQVSFLSGDAETISFPDKSTLITSCSALQWFDSPEEFFKRCNTLLHSQGYFAFSTFGKKNIINVLLSGKEIVSASPERKETCFSLNKSSQQYLISGHKSFKHIPSPCPKVIEFGRGTGIYSRMLLRTLRPEELLLNDLCPEMRYCCEDLLREKQVSFLSFIDQ